MPLNGHTVHPRLLDTITRYYPQTITIERMTTGARDEYGSRSQTWVPIPGHPLIDGEPAIRARVVSNGPGTGAGGWSGEVYAPDGTYDVDGRTMSLLGNYADVTESDRAVYDGKVYEIQSVETDAEGVTTRLRTRKVS